MLGNVKAKDDAIAALKNKGLLLNIVKELSCEIKFSKNKKYGLLGPPIT